MWQMPMTIFILMIENKVCACVACKFKCTRSIIMHNIRLIKIIINPILINFLYFLIGR